MKAWEALTGACETHGVSVEREREQSAAEYSLCDYLESRKDTGKMEIKLFSLLDTSISSRRAGDVSRYQVLFRLLCSSSQAVTSDAATRVPQRR